MLKIIDQSGNLHAATLEAYNMRIIKDDYLILNLITNQGKVSYTIYDEVGERIVLNEIRDEISCTIEGKKEDTEARIEELSDDVIKIGNLEYEGERDSEIYERIIKRAYTEIN